MGALLLTFCLPRLVARNAFVLISGGDSPWENNYSQYLQARGIARFLEHHYPPSSVWIFFGAGNVAGQPPIFGDVHREVREAGYRLDTWLPGFLPHNHPARREVILSAFRTQILPAVADGGTLYLFVGDHGSESRGLESESIINLWSFQHDPGRKHGWRADHDQILGVSGLRDLLLAGIGKGQVQFCMTQCHSGGFHYLALPRVVTVDPRWFTTLPGWATRVAARPFLRAAGFTATDESSPAAGCEPAPDPVHWAGYERYFPEKLFGFDLYTLKPIGKPLNSFADAHIAATLVDTTIDKPYSTSEQYLERWADLIESRLVQETNLAASVRRAVAAYQHTVNGAEPMMADDAFRRKQAVFQRFMARLAEQCPSIGGKLLLGTREDLQRIIRPRPNLSSSSPRRGRRPGWRRARFRDLRRLWNETLRPAWSRAVQEDRVETLPDAAREFERHLLVMAFEGNDLFLRPSRRRLQEEVFWYSGYDDPAAVNRVRAEAISRWSARRRDVILNWARVNADPVVRRAGQNLWDLLPHRRVVPGPASRPSRAVENSPRIDPKTAAERTLFYRRVLAAWQFLLVTHDRPALDRLRQIIALETTALPRSHSD